MAGAMAGRAERGSRGSRGSRGKAERGSSDLGPSNKSD